MLFNAVYDGYDFGLRLESCEGLAAYLKPHRARYIKDRGSKYARYWILSRQSVQGDGFFENMAIMYGRTEAPGVARKSVVEDCLSKIGKALISPDRAAFTQGMQFAIYPVAGFKAVLSSPFHRGINAVCHDMRGRFSMKSRIWIFDDTSPAQVHMNLVMAGFPDSQIRMEEGAYEIFEGSLVAGGARNDDARIHLGAQDADDTVVLEDGALGSGEPGAVRPLDPLRVEDPIKKTTDVALPVISARGTALKLDLINAALVNYQLYDYQRTGVRHLLTHTSSLLADDMGLGKSRQGVVACSIVRGNKPVLIACPASLIYNWEKEIRLIHPDAKVAIKDFPEGAEWVVCNYENLARFVGQADQFAAMILDEAHVLKNPLSKRTRVAFEVAAKIPYRFLMTGTPVMNRESEIYTLLRLSGHHVALGEGNTLANFIEKYANTAEGRRKLRLEIGDWMLRRRKDEALKDLPPKTQDVRPYRLNEAVEREYLAIINHTHMSAMDRLQKARMFLETVKMELIANYVSEIPGGAKIVIFSEFQGSVERMVAMLERAGRKCVSFSGKDSIKKRQAAVDAFQNDPQITGFVGTTGAAAVGHTLTAGSYVAFLSLPWTAALKNQAEDRCHRNGQKSNVTVYVPIVKGTMDVNLLQIYDQKDTMALDVVDGIDYNSDRVVMARKKLVSDLKLDLQNKEEQRKNRTGGGGRPPSTIAA